MTAVAAERPRVDQTPGGAAARPTRVPSVVVHGDFNCPWSYLAFRRTCMLAADGVEVDWRAVEHEPRRPLPADRRATRLEALRAEMPRVLSTLLPGEPLPYDLAGFVPWTDAAVAAYAEGRIAQADARVRRVLFEAFWMHGIDISDAKVLRTLLTDELRGSASPAEAVRAWGYPVDITGGPISSPAHRAIRRWATEWEEAGERVVPMVQAPGIELLHGVAAVEWLGDQVRLRDIDPSVPALPSPEHPRGRDLPDLGWVTGNGGEWLPRWQRWAADRRISR